MPQRLTTLKDIILELLKVSQRLLPPRPAPRNDPCGLQPLRVRFRLFSQRCDSFWTSVSFPRLKKMHKSAFRGAGSLSCVFTPRVAMAASVTGCRNVGNQVEADSMDSILFLTLLVVTLNSCHHLWGKRETSQGKRCKHFMFYTWQCVKMPFGKYEVIETLFKDNP